MKQNQKIILAIGLGLVILLNIAVVGWALSELFVPSRDERKETAATTEPFELTAERQRTEESTSEVSITTSEEISTEESTMEETAPAESTKDVWVEIEVPLSKAKKVIYTCSWGDGQGQVGFRSEAQGGDGPDGFAVENGIVSILDDVNGRILVIQNGSYQELSLDMYPNANQMIYQAQRIAVFDQEQNVTAIYQKSSNVKVLIDTPESLTKQGSVLGVVKVGEDYVVWEVQMNGSKVTTAYRYDWLANALSKTSLESDFVFVSVSDPSVDVIGTHGEDVYYSYVDTENKEYIINRETDGGRIYTRIDYSDYRTFPSQFTCLSVYGGFYLMECFEDRVEISELVLEIGAVE